MKNQFFILTSLLSLFSLSLLNAQIIGGRGDGAPTASEVNASEVNAGGFSGDVSLFTGTYNSNYTLGTVSNPSGLSFTANLSYGSTFSSGDNLPHLSGVPYGDGWNLDIPTISVSVEDFNKYSDINLGLASGHGVSSINFSPDPSELVPPYTPQYSLGEQKREGSIFFLQPKIKYSWSSKWSLGV